MRGRPALPAATAGAARRRNGRLRSARRAIVGLLWRLSKDGRDSWLFGTIHVGKLAWSAPGPALRQALARSDVLALEIDPTDPQLAARLQQATRDAPAADAALRQRLQAQAGAACLPPDALQGLHPMLQLMTLTLLQARRDGLDAAFAQELMLAAAARAAGLRIVALESVAQQIGALLPQDPAQMQRLLEQSLDQLERGRASPLLRRLAEAWAAGDLDTLERYAQWCECADTDRAARLAAPAQRRAQCPPGRGHRRAACARAEGLCRRRRIAHDRPAGPARAVAAARLQGATRGFARACDCPGGSAQWLKRPRPPRGAT